AALVMRPPEKNEDGETKDVKGWRKPFAKGAEYFNRGFDWLSDHFGKLTARLVRLLLVMFGIYAVLLGLTGWRLVETPVGFIPEQDQGNLIISARLPEGASLERSRAVAKEIAKIALKAPGVLASSIQVGVDPTSNTNATNSIQAYVILKPFAERDKAGLNVEAITSDLEKRTRTVLDADIKVIAPPPVRGIGTAGGFKMEIEDRGNKGYAALEKATNDIVAAVSGGDGADSGGGSGGGGDAKSKDDKKDGDVDTSAVTRTFTTFNTKTPRLHADIDRQKAQVLGVQDSQVFAALETYLASSYINDFNYLGRTFQVRAQADWPYRRVEADLTGLKTRSASGVMAPLGSFVTINRTTGPYRVSHYNLYPASEVQGSAAQGKSSGDAIKAMEGIARKVLPPGFTYEWTEIAYQQTQAGNTAYLVFGLAVVFAFLVLAALYESMITPIAVLLIVPMCLLAAMIGVNLRGLDNNILTQVGLIVLVGLAAKNAILIVEFAKQDEDGGASPEDAAVQAAKTRLRPILMTSLAFILGVLPLAFASGAGAEMRQALGTAVLFGMVGVTLFGLVFTPAFYVATRKLAAKIPRPKNAPKTEQEKNEAKDKDAGNAPPPAGAEPEPQS
ncbi:MAG: efflux RND transporter permease subunit, partial [Janthinobacterium lividum]